MAIAYLLGKGTSKALHTKINIPLLLVLSILPDIDIIYDYLTGAEVHRGPTHSIIVAALIFTPIFIRYGKEAIPYFLALISHSVIADFIIGGKVQLFWPLTNQEFGLHELGGVYIDIFNPINMALEMTLFIIAMLLLYKSGDWKVFFKPNKLNLVLFIPIVCVLLPSTIGYPFRNSLLFTSPTLAIAHLIFLGLFVIAVYKTIAEIYRQGLGNKVTNTAV
ncbi:MAG TPA: metal-dependent hydrolase [Candidatus Acidoferrales bacterium]|nr:metal-dependent hydrolase [Candidatus Acidoferrales bacterium]